MFEGNYKKKKKKLLGPLDEHQECEVPKETAEKENL